MPNTSGISDKTQIQTVGLKLVDKLVNIFLSTYVHIESRLVENEYFQARHQTTGYRNLFAFTTGKQAYCLFH